MADGLIINPKQARSGAAGGSRWARIVVSLLAVALLLVLALELVLRFVLGLGNPPLMQPDAQAGYVLKPDQHLYRFFKHTDINGYSMRSPEIAVDKPAGIYRVLLIGDSMTYGGTQVDQKEIFSSLLASELPKIVHKPVEVLNASASAYGIGNELGYLASRGTFQSDLVLLVLNSGDMEQSTSTLREVGGGASTSKPPCALCELWTRFLAPRVLHIHPTHDAGSQMGDAAAVNVAPNLARLDRFYQITQAQHAPMGILFLAARAWVPSKTTASASPALVGWAEHHHVPLVDITDAETVHSVLGITQDGIHFNAAGHRVAATAIEQRWGKWSESR